MDYNPQLIERLKIELARCIRPGFYNTYKDEKGAEFTAGGESYVKKHLTSSYDHVEGRQWRFPGIANGWEFESAMNAAGYKIVKGINYRGQTCRVVVAK